MENHPIEGLMRSTMENIKSMIDVDTIVGNPVTNSDGTVILPISKVSVGFASGGTDFSNDNKVKANESYPFGGGSGAGVTVKPVAFLVVKNDSIRLLPVDQTNTYDKIVDTVPQILDILKGAFKKDKDNS